MAKSVRDKKILQMQKEIAEQKEALLAVSKSKFKTNLVLPLGTTRVNLNILTKDEILIYIAQLVSIPTNLKVVGITDVPELGGFSIEDWIHDLRHKYMYLNRRAEEERLTRMENALENLLSEDVKKDKAFEDIIEQMKKKS